MYHSFSNASGCVCLDGSFVGNEAVGKPLDICYAGVGELGMMADGAVLVLPGS